MQVHKILLGDNAGLYLPLALHRLRSLNRLRGDRAFFCEKFRVEGYQIEVQQSPPQQFVRIIQTGGPAFEFFTSEHIDGQYYATPGHYPFQTGGVPFICGSGVRAKASLTGLASAPIFSTELVPDPNGRQWGQRNCNQPGFFVDGNNGPYFKAYGSWSAGWYGEYAWWPNNKPDKVVLSTWGVPAGRSSFAGHGDYHWSSIVGGAVPPYDIFYDVAPTLYTADGGILGVLGPYLGQYAWWRHAAVQTVQGRQFFIVGDNKGRLHVYPVKAYQQDATALAGQVAAAGATTSSTGIPFKTVTPPYPDWVTLADPNAADVLLWWNWNFNKDATKAAAIALHEEPRAGYFFYTDGYDVLNTTTWRALWKNSYRDAPPAQAALSKRGAVPRVLTPGLVEIGIEITLTGSGDMDFDVRVTLSREDYFGNSGRWYVDANYLFADPRINDIGLTKNALPEDTLITSELALYNTDGTWYFKRDTDPDTPGEQRGLLNLSDPSTYVEGEDWISAAVFADWIVRRRDTDAELIRERLAIDEPMGDWTFPITTFTPVVENGYGGSLLLTGIWLADFFRAPMGGFNTFGANTGFFGGKYRYAVINACDLRSLSYAVSRVVSDVTGVGVSVRFKIDEVQEDLHAFNQKVRSAAFRVTYGYPTGHFEDSPSTIAAELIDPTTESIAALTPQFTINPAATMLYACCAINLMVPNPYNEIRTHPKGHYSYCNMNGVTADAGPVVAPIDVLSVRTKKGVDRQTSHRALFNSAFEQARANDFYVPNGFGQELGSFRINGVWLPYKEGV